MPQAAEHEPDCAQCDGEIGDLGANKPADGLDFALKDELLEIALQVLDVVFGGRFAHFFSRSRY